MEITPIPCLTDNYAYVVRDTETGAAVVIDPSEHGPVLAALDAIRCRGPLHVEAILATHHHPDHVGGIDTIVRTAGVRRVIAHRSDIGRVPYGAEFTEWGLSELIPGDRRGFRASGPGFAGVCASRRDCAVLSADADGECAGRVSAAFSGLILLSVSSTQWSATW